MTDASRSTTAQTLSLPDELILILLNEQNGYFYQVPGWNLNCAVIGAVLAELSLLSRIDTDMESLLLLDATETGDPVLDPILKQIAAGPAGRNAQYWIERLVLRAEAIIDATLNRLIDRQFVKRHDGDFYTPVHGKIQPGGRGDPQEGTAGQSIKARIGQIILTDSIPEPRDAIVISLVNTCDVFRFIFEFDEEAEERIETICKMDLIGRSVAEAVEHSIASPLLRRSSLTKQIPQVRLRRLLLSPHFRTRNIPALFADLAKEYGPVFQLRPPFAPPLIFLAGPATNHWVHRNGRMHLRSRDYFTDLEKIYGASGLIPALDGADHFRLRKAMHPGYSRKKLEEQLDDLYARVRAFMAEYWKAGSLLQPATVCRLMVNAQVSPLVAGVDTQDIVENLIGYKERLLVTHVANVLPKFLLYTPRMKRFAKAVEEAVERVQSVHTPAQRAGCPRSLVDDLISLHASDPQFLPESNLGFFLSTPMLASMYLGDMLGFALYAMASQPALQDRIRSEADALFEGGDPDEADFTRSTIDVTRRFIMECLRMYPTISMSIRNVMNACVVEGFELPVGTRLHIAQTAAHYMDDVFPEPHSFDIDRYLPPRNEHLGTGYAPYGLGTHLCLGFRWVELQLTVNLMMIAHYFTLELFPAGYKLRIDPFPSMSPSRKFKLRIVEQRRELPA